MAFQHGMVDAGEDSYYPSQLPMTIGTSWTIMSQSFHFTC